MSNPEAIRKRKLDENIIHDFHVNKLSYKDLAHKYGFPVKAIQALIKENEKHNYSEATLNDVMQAKTNYNPLSLIDTFFRSAQSVSTELNFTEFFISELRTELMQSLAKKGINDMLASASDAQKISLWFNKSDKLLKQVKAATDLLQTYVDLYERVLDMNKQVSFVRVVMEILKKDSETFQKIQKALNEDETAKAVMEALDSDMILEYWKTGNTIPAEARRVRKEDDND